eukprot:INCI11290.1.p1 GENE.INCI11290.1~~INCI11290.1.p1  ORF type:complete len:674 (-),score=79.65 INCI11290.1:246-2267(-)
MFAALRDFVATHGHARVPDRYAPMPSLGTWVSNQRASYRAERARQSQEQKNPESANAAASQAVGSCRFRISPQHVALLEGVGFEWDARRRSDARWNQRLASLRAFRDLHGHTRVPDSYPPDKSLGKWVGHQRRAYRVEMRFRESKNSTPTEGKCLHNAALSGTTHLTAERMQQLSDIGFEWKRSDMHTGRPSQWEKRFAELKVFQSKHGHTHVPRGSPLRDWVAHQRVAYRCEKERETGKVPASTYRISRAHIRQLESIGFEWAPARARRDRQWEARFEQLRKWVQQHGNLRLPARLPSAGDISDANDSGQIASKQKPMPLRQWVVNQRAAYRAEIERKEGREPTSSYRLTPERIAKLNSIGFSWSRGGGLLRQESGSSSSSSVKETNTSLSSTARTIVSSTAPPATPTWEQRYVALQQFVKAKGHVSIRRNYGNDPGLAAWVECQRFAFAAATRPHDNEVKIKMPVNLRPPLSTAQISQLESLGEVFTATRSGVDPDGNKAAQERNRRWEAHFDDLKRFIAENGHAGVTRANSSSNPKLVAWVLNQRAAFKAKQARLAGRRASCTTTISEQRIARLCSVGFQWSVQGRRHSHKGALAPSVSIAAAVTAVNPGTNSVPTKVTATVKPATAASAASSAAAAATVVATPSAVVANRDVIPVATAGNGKSGDKAAS